VGRDVEAVRRAIRLLTDFVRALDEEPETVVRALRIVASRIETEDREQRASDSLLRKPSDV
jgi:hypothetical protein